MRRYWLDHEDLKIGEELEVSGEAFKHIFKVCRFKEGERFEVLNSHGAHLVEVLEVQKKASLVKVIEKRKVPPLKTPHLHLILLFPRPQVLERVLEKSVELGVKSVQVLTSSKSFFKSLDGVYVKQERLEKIVKQAMQQTGRVEGLELKPFCEFEAFMQTFDLGGENQAFVLYESSKALETSKFLQTSKMAKSVYLLVGGEGGFSEDEARLAREKGFMEVSLGSQILRVETACVAGLSILKSKFGVW